MHGFGPFWAYFGGFGQGFGSFWSIFEVVGMDVGQARPISEVLGRDLGPILGVLGMDLGLFGLVPRLRT